MKTCRECRETKPPGAFYRIRDGVLSARCRRCTNKKHNRAESRKAATVARSITRTIMLRLARLEALPHDIPNDAREPLEAAAKLLLHAIKMKRVRERTQTDQTRIEDDKETKSL